MPGHSHRIAPSYDLELAKRLLADAGYPGGDGLPEIRVAIPEESAAMRGVNAIESDLTAQWAQLGARVQILSAPFQSFYAGPFEVAHAWYTGYTADFPDPEGLLPPLLHLAPPLRDEEITALLAQARARCDREERIQLFREIDRLLVAERGVVLPTTYGANVVLRRPWVHGLRALPLNGPSTPLDQVVVRH